MDIDNYTQAMKIIGFVGAVDTILLLIILIRAVYLWFTGISPLLFRLGNNLAKSKIAIFAKGDNLSSLKSLILDSGLFKNKNIIEITNTGDIGKAEVASVYLVSWQDWATNMNEILNQKPDKCALVVYAPFHLGRISEGDMANIDGKRHTAVTNFRGRLLNDIVTSMITTSYELR